MFSQKEETVYAIQKYILSHLYETITLAHLAALCDCSEWQCYRLFKDVAGMSIADYIRRAKLSFLSLAVILPNTKNQIFRF